MKVKNSISTTMRTLKGRETKDKAAKNIFSYKPIMGNILKYTVAEYRDCSLEEIMNCIEGDTIQTGTAFVEEDMAGSIRGEQTEFNTTDEAPAVFDILFRSLLPKILNYRRTTGRGILLLKEAYTTDAGNYLHSWIK